MKKKSILLLLLLAAVTLSSCNIFDVVHGAQKFKKYEDAKNMEFSEVDEFYIGRQILATFFGKREPVFNRKLSSYLNSVGQTLVAVSQRPDIWAGYRFIAFNSPEMAAYSIPGGFILVSTGLLARCQNEDQLAAVLGHELAHARWRHPLEALKEKMVAQRRADLVAFMASRSGNSLVQIFSIAAIINWENQLSRYSRTQELEADAYSCWLMMMAGYDPLQMISVLRKIPGGRSDYSKYHPSVDRRLQVVRREIARYKTIPPMLEARKTRYRQEVLSLLGNLNKDDTPDKDRDDDDKGGDKDDDKDDN